MAIGQSQTLACGAIEAMKNADTATAYNKWLTAEVQEAIDDTSPTIPHAEVMHDVRALITRVRTAKRAHSGTEDI